MIDASVELACEPVGIQLQAVNVPVAFCKVVQRLLQGTERIFEFHVLAILPIQNCELLVVVPKQRVQLPTDA